MKKKRNVDGIKWKNGKYIIIKSETIGRRNKILTKIIIKGM